MPPFKEIHSVVLFAADWWEHVCPVLRVVGPIQQAGLDLIRGTEWEEGSIRIFPERVSEADVVVIQRDFPRYQDAYDEVVTLARSFDKAVVYEIDDLLIDLPNEHPDIDHYQEARVSMLQAIVEADVVTTPSSTLCEYIRPFNSNTMILHNYLNDTLWDLASHSTKGKDTRGLPPIVGYLGGHSHAPDLAMIAPVLLRILRRYGDQVLFKFWGVAPPPELKGLRNVDWVDLGLVDYAEFASYFIQQKCDIFFAPLCDNIFNQCKSALKFLEYSVLGVPGVYSRITPYESIVVHGKTGYLASNEREWEEYLSRLIDTPDLRAQIGKEAQRIVRENWLLSGHENEWVKVYKQAIVLCEQRRGRGWESPSIQRLISWYHDLEAEVAEERRLSQQLRDKIVELELKIRELQAKAEKLAEILSSTAWQITQVVQKIRLHLAPRGSLRERLMYLGVRSVRFWQRSGFRGVTRRTVEIITRREKYSQETVGLQRERGDAEPPHVQPMVTPGQAYPSPAISLVIISDDASQDLQQKTTYWVDNQTTQSVEIVLWMKEKGLAQVLNQVDEQWKADDLSSFLAGINGRYVCLVTPDLLVQAETYLESNLISLETESLAFTINILGDKGRVSQLLGQGLLPGGQDSPLLRLVARKDCLEEGFTIDVTRWLSEKAACVVGKIILHTTSIPDVGDSLPYSTKLVGPDVSVSGRYIMAREGIDQPIDPILHTIHQLDTVLPSVAEPSDLPTVIVIMPFLAVGGAERLLLHIMQQLREEIRFVVVTVEEHDVVLGTTTNEFRKVTPFVYNALDFLEPNLLFSFVSVLIQRFMPKVLYIANGSSWIYHALGFIKEYNPSLRIVDQVYHHQLGWISRYDPVVVANIDAFIGGNTKICQAYLNRGANTHQVHMIDHGIAPDELNPAEYPIKRVRKLKEKLGLPQDRSIVSFVARLHPQKRPLDFVELARRFRYDPSLAFLMIGDGPLAGTVHAQILQADLNNFYRHPFYHPISDIYALSDVVVLPSEYEAQPLVALEAQAMGKPVVVTDVGNNRDMLVHTYGGRLVERIGDIGALAAAVEKVLKEPIDSDQVRQAVLDRYGMPRIAEQYRQVLLGI